MGEDPGEGVARMGCAFTGSQSLSVGVGVAARVGSENPRNCAGVGLSAASRVI